jgi:hypothetical protein
VGRAGRRAVQGAHDPRARRLHARAQIEEIIDFTLVYYDQLAVMAHKVSDEGIIRHQPQPTAGHTPGG